MAASTTVNGRTVVHRTSGGTLATFPDVCLTPSGGGPVPVPYPNLARSADLARGSQTVHVDGSPVALEDSVFSRSTGDEPGTQKGVVSGAQGGEARFFNWSFDVKVEGRGTCRLLDPMGSNGGSPINTALAAEMQVGLAIADGVAPDLDHRHHLVFSFRHAHPDADKPGHTADYLDLGTPIRFTGPESETYSPVFDYPGATVHVWEPGDYTLRFESFDLEPRPLLPLSTVEALKREAKRRLERARGAADNAVEDLGEVADRLERDVRRAGANLETDARQALADARAHLETARQKAQEAADQLGRAVEQVEGGTWEQAARDGWGAAQDGADAVQEAADALGGLADDVQAGGRQLREALDRAVSDAKQGLRNAGRDAQGALGMGE